MCVLETLRPMKAEQTSSAPHNCVLGVMRPTCLFNKIRTGTRTRSAQLPEILWARANTRRHIYARVPKTSKARDVYTNAYCEWRGHRRRSTSPLSHDHSSHPEGVTRVPLLVFSFQRRVLGVEANNVKRSTVRKSPSI